MSELGVVHGLRKRPAIGRRDGNLSAASSHVTPHRSSQAVSQSGQSTRVPPRSKMIASNRNSFLRFDIDVISLLRRVLMQAAKTIRLST
jgi:hypothetical protein